MTSRCPYDPQHILPTDSLLNHLRKCKSTNKHLFTHCKYEPLHVVLKAELDSHYKSNPIFMFRMLDEHSESERRRRVGQYWKEQLF